MNQGLRLKKTRKYLKESQEVFAENTQNSVGTISMIERGNVKSINENIISYVESKGINTQWLLFEKGEMLKSQIEEDNSVWKERALKAEKEVSSLNRKFSEIQENFIKLQNFVLMNAHKLDLSKLDLGKDKTLLENGFVASAKVVRMPTYETGIKSGNVKFGY